MRAPNDDRGPDTEWVMRQAFIATMDEVERGALDFCNKVIADYNGTPQDILAPGRRCDAEACPISETIRRGIPAPARFYTAVTTGTTGCTVDANGRREDFDLTDEASMFASEFDNHQRDRYNIYAWDRND